MSNVNLATSRPRPSSAKGQARALAQGIAPQRLVGSLALLLCLLLALHALPVHGKDASAGSHCPALLDFRFPRLQDGASQDLCQYHGQVILVVNTASFCGNTPQYEGLEKLYRQWSARGLVVLGFPSNDFGAQEPGSNESIAEFCRLTYGVKFPMLAKSAVSGREANPLFRHLKQLTGEGPEWNFHKYLIGRDGKTVRSFSAQTLPSDPALLKAIEQQLNLSSAPGKP